MLSAFNSMLPASSFDRSNNWFIRLSNLLAFLFATCSFPFSLVSIFEDITFSICPRIKVSGVRNSCDKFAKKWILNDPNYVEYLFLLFQVLAGF